MTDKHLGKYSKHPYHDILAVFIAVIIILTFVGVALKGDPGTATIDENRLDIEHQNLVAQAIGPTQTIECNSCETCTELLAEPRVKEVVLVDDIFHNEDTACIAVNGLENKVLDCNFKTLDGGNSDESMISIIGSKDIRVSNCVVQRKASAIEVFDSEGIDVIDNRMLYCGIGVELLSSSGSKVLGNKIVRPSDKGITVSGSSSGNLIEQNSIEYSMNYGLKMGEGTRTVVLNNRICFSDWYDIADAEKSSSFGTGNTCDSALNWMDSYDGASEVRPCMDVCYE